MKGTLNINISFPIISNIENQFYVSQTILNYTVCKRSYIPILSRLNESIIDSEGVHYKRKEVSFTSYINLLGGLSLKYGGFGASFVHKNVEKLKILSTEQLKETGNKILSYKQDFFSRTDLPIEKWRKEFEILEEREDVLRYLFYFTDTSRYHNPDIKDSQWRERVGFAH